METNNTMRGLKLLDAYDIDDRSYYFGRDEEIELLYAKVDSSSRLTVLQGLSGTGKTSLIQCGLASKSHLSDWMHIIIRRNDESLLTATLKKVQEHAISLIDDIDIEALEQQHSDKEEDQRVAAIIALFVQAVAVLCNDYGKTIHLIFDQFEELFTNGDERERLYFSQFLAKLISQTDVKVILSLREEYMAYLDEFERTIPHILDNRMRLEHMNEKKLDKVIANILQEQKMTSTPRAVTNIIKKLRQEGSKIVELPDLQVYLYKLISAQDDGDISEQDVEDMGSMSNVLGVFLEDNVRLIAKKKSLKEEDIWNVLKTMITARGTKIPMSVEKITTAYNKDYGPKHH